MFYHLHKLDTYSLANFLKYYPKAQLLTILRNPLQSCESWAVKSLNYNSYIFYSDIVQRISPMLLDLNSPAFSAQSSVGIRLEDIKTDPEKTMRRLCDYLGIEEAPSLYASTMQGMKWWGDPGSSLYGKTQTDYDAASDPTGMEVGSFFSDRDQFILNTLFYPLSSRFGYVDEDEGQFRKDLKEIRPYLEHPLDFEVTLAQDFPADYPDLEKTEAFKTLHGVLMGVWGLLDEQGTYPHMMDALPGA